MGTSSADRFQHFQANMARSIILFASQDACSDKRKAVDRSRSVNRSSIAFNVCPAVLGRKLTTPCRHVVKVSQTRMLLLLTEERILSSVERLFTNHSKSALVYIQAWYISWQNCSWSMFWSIGSGTWLLQKSYAVVSKSIDNLVLE